MPSESSTTSTSTTSSHSVSSKPKSASSKSPAAATNVAVPSTTTTAKKIGLFAKVRALPVYIQALGVLIVIAFVYVATNKKALKLFEKKSITVEEGLEGTAEGAEMPEDAEGAEADEDSTTDDNADEAEPSEQLVEQKTVRFEDSA